MKQHLYSLKDKKKKETEKKKKKKICQLKILYPAKITFKDKSVSYQWPTDLHYKKC